MVRRTGVERVNFSIQMPVETHKLIQRRKLETGESQNAIVIESVEGYLGKYREAGTDKSRKGAAGAL